MLGISHEPTRAAVAGVLVGISVGLICMFLPHQLFWGEAQLQTLIDKGKTPLPVFETEGSTSILTHYGYCMIDHNDERAQIKGFSTSCVGILAFTKILTIGLSLGTGICGGHFWGPLYVGCAAGHFFSDIMEIFKDNFKLAEQLARFPCVSILCVMGSAHVVTYRCHMAIVLVLTLTITSFTSETKSGTLAGDYSAIFPLLVVACFVPLATARGTTFYAKQRCRGDISATTWVLSKAMEDPDSYSDDDYDGSSVLYSDDDDVSSGLSLENESMERTPRELGMDGSVTENTRQTSVTTSQIDYEAEDLLHVRKSSNSSSNVDPLAVSMHSIGNVSKKSTRSNGSRGRSLSREASGTRRKPSLSRGSSFGVEDFQLTLLEQSRAQAASVQASSRSGTPVPNSGPSIPRGHRRKGSNISVRSSTVGDMDISRHSTRS
jgi:Chloride channel protein EriC